MNSTAFDTARIAKVFACAYTDKNKETADPYTIFYRDEFNSAEWECTYICAGDSPNHPQGVFMHEQMTPAQRRAFENDKNNIPTDFADLPPALLQQLDSAAGAVLAPPPPAAKIIVRIYLGRNFTAAALRAKQRRAVLPAAACPTAADSRRQMLCYRIAPPNNHGASTLRFAS